MHPILFHLGPLALPSFGALLAIGLMLGLALSERTAPRAGVAPDRLWDAGLFLVIAAFVCSRGLLVVFNWTTFVRFPLLLLAVPSLTATGLLLTVAATLVWMWAKRLPLLLALEAWAPCGLLVWGFLALGHFAEGSDPGMPTSAAWGVHFPGEAIAQQPVALLAAVIAFALTALTLARLRRGQPVAALGLSMAGLAQVLVSFLRQPGVKPVLGLDELEWVGVGLMLAGGLLLSREVRAAGIPAGSSSARWVLRGE